MTLQHIIVGSINATSILVGGAVTINTTAIAIGNSSSNVVLSVAGLDRDGSPATGPQGSTGAQGSQGYQGYMGSQGSTGAQGAAGSQGAQGTSGVSTSNVTLTGNTTTGNVSVQGVFVANSNASVPVNFKSTALDPHILLEATNTTSTYAYLELKTTGAALGSGYLIKNGNNGGNGLANGTLQIWNDGGAYDIDLVAGGNTASRSTSMANGSLIVRGHIGLANTTPLNSAWGSNTDQLSIGGNRAYGLISLNGKSGSNTSFSSGVGDGNYYMCYDNVNSKHNIVVNSNGAVALRDAVTTATGVGITFPATQAASTNANTLDDYEEGTWSPWSPSDVTTYGITIPALARYTKIGNLVFIGVRFKWTSTSSGQIFMDLPFTAANFGDGSNSPSFMKMSFASGGPTTIGFLYSGQVGTTAAQAYQENVGYTSVNWNGVSSKEATVLGHYWAA